MNILNEIIISMKKIGGNVKLKDLYDDLRSRNIHIRYLDINSFEGTIRGELQSYCSKSNRFNGKEIFENVGHGIWRLKNNKEDIIKAAYPEKILIFIDSKDEEMFALSETRVFFKSIDNNLYPDIAIGNKDSLKFEINLGGFMVCRFTDQKNIEWEIGFKLIKDFQIDILRLLNSDYEISI